MTNYEKILTLDVSEPDYSKIVFAKQRDNLSRILTVKILINGTPYAYESGDIAVFRYTRPNKTENRAAATIDPATGYVSVVFDNQLLAIEGAIVCDIDISNGDKNLSTPLFFVQNDKSPGKDTQVLPLDEYQILLQTIQEAKSVGIVLGARIDELISAGTPEGAEIIDVRTDVTGKTYANAGTAVREQASELSDDMAGSILNILRFNSNRKAGSSYTNGGLTFDFSAPNKCAITGTAASNTFLNLYSNTIQLPKYMEAGKTYRFRVLTTSNAIGLRLYYYKLNDPTNYILRTIYADTDIEIPTDAIGLIARINVIISSSTTFNDTIEVGCVAAIDLQKFEKALSKKAEIREFSSAEIATPQDIFGSYNPNAWTGWVQPSWFAQDFNNLSYACALIKFGRDTNQSAFIAVQREYLKAVIGAKDGDGVERTANIKLTSFHKSLAMFGDSITWGRDGNRSAAYPTKNTFAATVARNLGIICSNYGVGSAGYLAKGSDGKNAYEKISSTNIANYDYISLAYGVNDVLNHTVGEWNSTDEETIMGQFNKCINYIYGQNESCVVIVIAPWNGRNIGTFPKYKYGDSRMINLTNALKTACEYYGISYISQKDCPINGFTIQNLIGADGVHPSEEGYLKIGSWLSGEIGRIIG